ncbi:hypothetical protein [Streptomyces beijiangensis]|uniref:WXG100 family type VII secretion target n=1 Tax=Streptomyces beijiangensis TaxID=163361 RepID=A0A939F2Y4_9ACTN|nr:hypothetical protein [Streptomyces beijiangensis]MBO0511285.1 hypothetical protein [Streptomyces beijiangensis]
MAYGGGYYDPKMQEQMEQQRKQRIQDKHDEKLEKQSNGGKGGPDRSKLSTDFMTKGIPELRDMVLNSDPDAIYTASQAWKQVHKIISGGDGNGAMGTVDSSPDKGSIAGLLTTAVTNVLEHWEGQAAQAFAKKANEVSGNLMNGAAFANLAGGQMEAVQNDLRNAKAKMRDIHEPSGWDKFKDKFGDDGRDDTQLKKDIANGVSTEAAEKANADMLSKGKERQLEAVAVMEQLGVNYVQYSDNLDKNSSYHSGDKEIKPPQHTVTTPPPITPPSHSGTTTGLARSTSKWDSGQTKRIGDQPNTPKTPHIPESHTLPSGPTHGGDTYTPPVGTNIDGIAPTPPSGGIGSGGGGGTGGLSGGGGIGTGGLSSGGGIGGPGSSGFGGASSSGMVGGAGAGRSGGAGGGGAAGAGRGAAAGRGMGGAGGGAGGGARGGASGAGGRGALARARGGAVGAAKGIANKTGAGAGSGLHGSRGGSQRGAAGGGGMGGAGGRGKKKGQSEGSDRPDYLVEDEETWISEEQGRIVPPTIQ